MFGDSGSTKHQNVKVRGHCESSKKPSETNKICLGGWGFFEKIALWASNGVLYTHWSESWSLKCAFLFVLGGRGGGVQVKLILFVSLGFCKLLRWPLTFNIQAKMRFNQWLISKRLTVNRKIQSTIYCSNKTFFSLLRPTLWNEALACSKTSWNQYCLWSATIQVKRNIHSKLIKHT